METLDSIYHNYNIKVKNVSSLTNKTYKIICENNNCFFIKDVQPESENKYNFLASIGVNNIIYPIINQNKNFISKTNEKNYYISDYIDNYIISEDSNSYKLFNSLNYLHEITTVKKQLSRVKSKPKFEEITKQLDYKFKLIENFIRSIEMRPINPESMLILENYHIILDCKNELIMLQKSIIQSIKDNESVDYVFVHNNPKIEHLIMNKGIDYLTSVEHGKIGISSLDIAKFYIENQHNNLDFKQVLFEDYYSQKDVFYYNYFKFMVLFIYIKHINISNLSYFNVENFVDSCKNIACFIKTFIKENSQI